MSLTIQPDAVAQLLATIRKDIQTERVKFQGMDLYKCGLVDGRLAALLQLRLISPETFDELMALGDA